MVDLELHDEVVDWMDTLADDEWDRTVVVIERTEIARARKAAAECAKSNP